MYATEWHSGWISSRRDQDAGVASLLWRHNEMRKPRTTTRVIYVAEP